MDTPITVEVVAEPSEADARCEDAANRAFSWFAAVEAACSRFDPKSELRRLAERPGVAVPVGPVLFHAVRLAREVARQSGGAFDPAVGCRMEARGFDREYRTGLPAPSGIRPAASSTWRDVLLDARNQAITLRRPLLLDLGGVAKGLAAELAVRELAGFPGSAIDAGGDLAVRGVNPDGGPWRIGIRHPRRPGAVCAVVEVAGGAVCTSGDYERRAADGGGHHVDPRTGAPAAATASCTVLAADAALADALSTAASVLPPDEALPWLARQGVEALVLTAALEPLTTPGLARLEVCV